MRYDASIGPILEGNGYAALTVDAWMGMPGELYLGRDGDRIGVGMAPPEEPQRPLHIKDVMRLEPRSTQPSDPSEGDLYVSSADHHIYCYLNGGWKRLDN